MSMVVGLPVVSGNATGTATSLPVNDNNVKLSGLDYAFGAAAEASAAVGNRGTSHLGSLEFNTPYAPQIAALAAVLAIVATVSVFLAVKFTSSANRRATIAIAAAAPVGAAKSNNSSDACEEVVIYEEEDDNCSEDDGQRRSTWECAPILLHRLVVGGSIGGSIGGRYESLQQTDCDRRDGGGSGASGCGGVFHFSARRDPANGLLCLYAMRVVLLQCGGPDCRACVQPSMEGHRQIVIDIVTQTDIERRQTRLQTRLAATAPRNVWGLDEADDDDDEDQAAEGSSWCTEPLDDVLTVKLGQSRGAPLQGQLRISVLSKKSSESAGSPQRQRQQKLSMARLGWATFPVDRIVSEASGTAAASFSVSLRGDSQ